MVANSDKHSTLLLRLLTHLSSGRQFELSQLSESLEAPESQISALIDQLREAGIAVEESDGLFSISQNQHPESTNLCVDEALGLLILAQSLTIEQKRNPLVKGAAAGVSKIIDRLPCGIRNTVVRTAGSIESGCLSVNPELAMPNSGLKSLLGCFEPPRPAQLTYRKTQFTLRETEFTPYTLAIRNNEWTFIGYSSADNASIALRVSMITHVSEIGVVEDCNQEDRVTSR